LVRVTIRVLCVACWAIVGIAGSAPAAEPKAVVFDRDIKPVLQRLCIGCHGPQKQEDKLRLDRLSTDLVKGSDAETWHDVLNKLNLGEMPRRRPGNNRPPRSVDYWCGGG
jgi:hypothetical protein